MVLFDRLTARLRAAEERFGTRAVSMMRTATAPIRNRYHPELHYMRGPGPATARKAALGAGPATAFVETTGTV